MNVEYPKIANVANAMEALKDFMGYLEDDLSKSPTGKPRSFESVVSHYNGVGHALKCCHPQQKDEFTLICDAEGRER